MNKLRLIILLFISLITPILAQGQENERWYEVSIAGSPVGYLLEKNDLSDDQNTTVIEMNISIGRLGSSVNMETRTTQIEKAGKLMHIHSELNFSNERKVESVQVMEDHLIIEAQGNTRSLPLEKKLTGSKLLEELVIHQIENGQESINYTIYLPEMGMFMNGRIDFKGTEKIKINGVQFDAILVEERFKEMPYVKKKWLSKDGKLLKSEEPNPFGEMAVIWSTKEKALGALNNSVDLPEEQYGNSMAYSNYRLSQPRNLSSVKIKIMQKKPEYGFPDFSGDYQHIVSKSDEEIVLLINKAVPGEKQAQQGNLDEYLAPNAYTDNSDELIIEKTKDAIGSEKDDWKKAQLITDWVRKNMSFDAGIALANSREVVRDLKGTCVSYAILTTTMSKAAGIPARFLMGYVYVDGAWGGHAWSEVNISGQWIPIDAAVPNSSHVADPARFFMVRSSLKDGVGAANIAGMQLFGNIDVKILEYSMDNEKHIASEKAYSIENATYSNPGVRFKMKQLEGFQFSDLDKFYPENTILKQTDGKSEIMVSHWNYGNVEDAEGSIARILSLTENENKPQPFKTDQYEGIKVTGIEKTIAIMKVDSKTFFTLTVTGPEQHNVLADALKAIN